MSPEKAVAWLNECANYFAKRPTGGEDMSYWSNVANAESARKIAEMIAATIAPLDTKGGDNGST